MNYNYQDAKMESQQEYFGTIHIDNKKTLQNVLERIAELEKENAELKAQNRKLLESCAGATMIYKDLCKAKEIIKKFLLWENDWHNKTESKYELLKQAEQFLEETE